jgi:DNA-binding transcriptional LysR family regulator
MDLTQLKSFVTVAKLGHLTRAAEAVHLSQPAISGQIKALEGEFGLPLFERTPSGMLLTPAGKRLLGYAETVIGDVQSLRHAAQELAAQLTGRLRLGTVLDPAFLRVGELIARTFERHPAVELDLHQVVSHDALEQVRSGELDASFYFGTLPQDLAGVALRTMTYRVLVPNALAAQTPANDWPSVARQPWVVTPERSSHRQLVSQLFAERGGEFAPAIEADNESVITNLVESGVGVGLVRDEIALASAQAGRAVIWPDATMQTELWLVHAQDRRFDPLIVAILDVLRELWRADAMEPAVVAG